MALLKQVGAFKAALATPCAGPGTGAYRSLAVLLEAAGDWRRAVVLQEIMTSRVRHASSGLRQAAKNDESNICQAWTRLPRLAHLLALPWKGCGRQCRQARAGQASDARLGWHGAGLPPRRAGGVCSCARLRCCRGDGAWHHCYGGRRWRC